MNAPIMWQDIGWNGIWLQVPHDWHPAVILADYLLFETGYHPVFEIRWQTVPGRFSAQGVLRKLARSLDDARIIPCQLPPDWRTALADRHQVHGFEWQQPGAGGRGILLHNPSTSMAMLLRFHQAEDAPTAPSGRILASLREQPQEGAHTWTIFDISARLPARMRLVGQRFLPGSYTIDFRQDHLLLSLLRFKPAQELLRHRSLAQFGGHLADGAQLVHHNDHAATWQEDGSTARTLLRRLQGKKAHQVLVLWHIPQKNVILGLHGKSNRPIQKSLLQEIKTHYTAL